MILILPIAFISILTVVYTLNKNTINEKTDFAKVLLQTLLIYELGMVLMANLLSIGNKLSRISVFMFWLIVAVVFLLCLYGINIKKVKSEKNAKTAEQPEKVENQKLAENIKYVRDTSHVIREDIKEKIQTEIPTVLRMDVHKIWKESKLIMLLSLLIITVLLLGSIFTVPYNYDSMTYHLSRIGHWIDQGNVNYYVTNIDRQLFSPVLSEYNLLAMYLLCNNDWLLNFQQFFAMLISMYLCYKIARRLRTSEQMSMLAAFAYLTMPLTISQTVTTQNDLSAGMWLLFFAYELLWFIQTDSLKKSDKSIKENKNESGKANPNREILLNSICMGMTVGFAYLMKPTACVSMVMFMPWLLIVCIQKRNDIKKLLLCAGSAIVAMGIVVSETLIRTYRACGSFTADATSGDIMVATKNVGYIIVNILKNYNLLITQHFFKGLNGAMCRFTIRMGALLSVDVNNIAISYHGFDLIKYMNWGDDMYSHDRSPSAFAAYLALLAGILLVVAIFILIFSKKGKASRIRNITIGYVVSAWLSFGFMMALLRWQPWGTRLMYPSLILVLIASVHILDGFLPEGKCTYVLCLFLSVLTMTLCIKSLEYNLKPALNYVENGLRDREEMYFVHNDRRNTYLSLIEKAKEIDAKDVGVVISGDGYDYPLWEMFRQHDKDARLRHVLVDDTIMQAYKGKLSGENFKDETTAPDCILWIERGRLEEGQTLDFFGKTYVCIFTADDEKAPDSILIPATQTN